MRFSICAVFLISHNMAFPAGGEIRVPPLIDLSKNLNPRYIRIGPEYDMRVVLVCAAYGNPEPEITWQHNGDDIQQLNSTLELEVNPDDVEATAGVYQCIANNSEGTIKGDAVTVEAFRLRATPASLIGNLDVHNDNPTPDYQEVEPGSSLLLHCGSSPPSSDMAFHHYWYKVPTTDQLPPNFDRDGPIAWEVYNRQYSSHEEDLISAAQLEHGRFVKYFRSLLLTYALERDSGFYVCKGTKSGSGRIHNYAMHYIKVTGGAGPRMHSRSDFEIMPSYSSGGEMTVLKGDYFTLSCIPRADPTPRVTWLKEDQPLPENDRFHIGDSNRTLLIDSATVDDSGRYTCIAASSPAVKATAVTTVTIQYAPIYDRWKLSSNISARVGDSVTFYCNGDAEPTAHVDWYFNGWPVTDKHHRWKLDPGNLNISLENFRESDTGTVVCNVSNPLDYFLHPAYLIADESPPGETDGPCSDPTKQINCGPGMQAGENSDNLHDWQTIILASSFSGILLFIVVGTATYFICRRQERTTRELRTDIEDLRTELHTGRFKRSWRPPFLRSISSPPQLLVTDNRGKGQQMNPM